jgi:hypothetical protein
MSSNNKTKSLLAKTVLTVTANKMGKPTPITLTIEAIELNYGPVIDLTIRVSDPLTEPMDWDDHPFMFITKFETEDRSTLGNIIDDTPATRALIDELVCTEKKTRYTTTDCSHKGRLIRALSLFWS